MMLFNIKQCRWRSVARQEFEQEFAAGVRTHIENNVFEFEKTWRDAARRCASGVRPPLVSKLYKIHYISYVNK